MASDQVVVPSNGGPMPWTPLEDWEQVKVTPEALEKSVILDGLDSQRAAEGCQAAGLVAPNGLETETP